MNNEKINRTYKENPADTAAREWLCEQEALAGKRRVFDVIMMSVLGALIVIFGILIFLLPKPEFSEEENRVLADFPSFSIESLVSGEFTSGIAEFYADRFPARNFFIGVKALTEKLMLKGENNGAIEGYDGYIVERLEYTEEQYEILSGNLAAIGSFEKLAKEKGIDTSVLLLPRSIDVMDSKLPSLYDTSRADAVWDVAFEAYPNALTVTEALEDAASRGEYVWYKTDHHYTTLGAYYTYCALGESLGYEPYPIEYFTKEVASSEFLGTTYSSSGIKWAKKDVVTLFRFEGDEDYTVTFPNDENMKGFYNRSFLETKDKYSVFLGGNRSRTTISREGEDLPTLLLIKDSFSNSLAPFLALHFEVELLDLRYYNASAAKLIDELAPDKLLIAYGIDTIATSPETKKIMMGAK